MSSIRFVAPLCLAALSLSGWSYGQGLKYERWNNLGSGFSLETVKKDGVAQRAADVTSTTITGAVPENVANNYGARLSGYVTAPETGDYTFYVKGDDIFELWASPDSNPLAKQRAAWGDWWVESWDAYLSQRSITRRLQAGQQFYVESFLKESGGADNLSIGWFREPVVQKTATAIGANVTQTWSESNGTVSLSVDAGDIWDTADRFGFYNRAWIGDGEIVARVSSMNNPWGWAKVGVMLRASHDADSMHALIARTPGNGYAFQRRKTTGGGSVNNNSNYPYLDAIKWVKLIRKGETISASISIDGIEWINMGSDTFTGLPATVYVGIAASDIGPGTSPVVATVEDFAVRPLVPTEVVPGSVLTPYTNPASDNDGNRLPDAWENQYPLAGDAFAESEFGDPDGDLLTNGQEALLGTNPMEANKAEGNLRVETWNNVPFYSVQDLIQSPKFYGAPDSVALKPQTGVRSSSTYFASRGRGYITPSVSGDYTFWVSARTSAELWLSTDVTQGKYGKKRIAMIDSSLGHGHGIPWTSTNLWDQFSHQRSVTIPLQAGQTYYLETLQQHGHSGEAHCTIAWSRNGGMREMLPMSVVSAYHKTADDADDDYLPDAWETQYGLDAADNGAGDMAKQGERGDYDSDGLTNRDEYLLGTNPVAADTDGDGLSDFDEVRRFGTSPTTSNTVFSDLADTVTLTNYNPSGSTGTWQYFDGGLLGSTFRGQVEWAFTVPSDGWWVIDLGGRLRGTVRPIEDLNLGVKIDGMSLAEQTIRFTNGKPSSLKVLTPYLQAGTHSFTLDIRNEIGRRAFQIQSLKVFGPGGADLDENGRPDWLDTMLAQGNVLAPVPSESPVSPLFLEGSVRHLNGTNVAAAGQSVSVQRGLGDLHWFANAPLNTTGSTSILVDMENGEQTVNVTWSRWNAMAGQGLTVRAGDSVKIGGWITAQDSGNITITVGGQSQTIDASDSIVKTFPTAGSYPVTVSHYGGSQTTATITVVSANFGEPMMFYADTLTWRSFPQVPASLKITAEPSLVVDASQAEGTGQKVQLRPFRGGSHTLAARIPNGPIVALGSVITTSISDALRNDATEYIGSTADGYRIMRAPIVVTDLPPGGYVVLTIFRAGLTFLDGTTVMTLTAEDFVNGVAYVDFRYPANMTGGYCHYIDVYDAQGRHLGRR